MHSVKVSKYLAQTLTCSLILSRIDYCNRTTKSHRSQQWWSPEPTGQLCKKWDAFNDANESD